jgi:hypothetical protein
MGAREERGCLGNRRRRKLPPGWNRWSAAEKVEHLLGLRLGYLSWPADDLDHCRLAVGARVIRVVAMVAAKVGARRVHREAAERFRPAMRETGDLDEARPVYGKPGGSRGGLEKLGRPRNLRRIFFRSHSPADAGRSRVRSNPGQNRTGRARAAKDCRDFPNRGIQRSNGLAPDP